MQGNGPQELRRLVARLASVDRHIQADLRQRLRDVAEPAAEQTRQEILSAPSKHGGTLRSEIARTVSVQASVPQAGRVSVRITSDGRRMPEGKTTMAAHANDARFRHPVFGDDDKWVSESIAPGWFTGPLNRNRGSFAGAVQRAMEDTGRWIAGGG